MLSRIVNGSMRLALEEGKDAKWDKFLGYREKVHCVSPTS